MASTDSDEEESFVVIGTAFELPSEDELRRKKIQVEDLPVKDSRGRVRFHGAFTGGFSAGYFNTAGSKEGWTPSTFTSSRSQRAERSAQQPEDFMDAEDLGEHGIAPRALSTTDSFVSQDATRKRMLTVVPGNDLITSDLLAELVVPDVTPVGIKLLRKMGWRDGQGIGPRRRKKQRRKDSKTSIDPPPKVYGCSLPPEEGISETSDSDPEFTTALTFGPSDVTPVKFTAQDNTHGIGYSGIDTSGKFHTSNFNLFETEAHVSSTGKRGIKGHAFGVGALEEDDEDVYSTDHLSNYHQTLAGDDDMEDSTFGWTAPRAMKRADVSTVSKTLEGFQLSSTKLHQTKVFPPPNIPPGFRPYHLETQIVPATTAPDRKSLNSLTRGLLLGEKPLLMEAATSKLSPLKQSRETENKKQMRDESSLSSRASRFSESSSATPNMTIAPFQISSVQESRTAVSNQYKPFSTDPSKQRRYEQYQSLRKQGRQDPYIEVVAGHMTEWERQREREEFGRASSLYKPLSGMMASRFTTAKYADDVDNATLPARDVEEKSDASKAAEMKMFGKLTREVLEWHPDKVVCKRFNVPDPYPGSQIVGLLGSKRKTFSMFNFLNCPIESDSQSSHQQEVVEEGSVDTERSAENKQHREVDSSGQKPKLTTANIFTAYFEEENRRTTERIEKSSDSTPQNNTVSQSDAALQSTGETQPGKTDQEDRPPMDLFKAIFQDSNSEVSSEEEEETAKTEKKTEVKDDMELDISVVEKTPQAELTSNMDSESQPVVDHISQTKVPEQRQLSAPTQAREDRQMSVESASEMFGPCLPPSATLTGTSISQVQNQSAEPARRRTEGHRKHKHRSREREKHSQKHKKKKSKHKKSKHKKKEKKEGKSSKSDKSGYDASSGDSEGEVTDSDLPADREILQRLKQVAGKGSLKLSDYL